LLVESPLLQESPLVPAESLAGAIVPGLAGLASRASRLLRRALALSPLELSPLELSPLPLELPDEARPVPCEPVSACCRAAAESTLPSHPPIC
jgi:hypothetical protein